MSLKTNELSMCYTARLFWSQHMITAPALSPSPPHSIHPTHLHMTTSSHCTHPNLTKVHIQQRKTQCHLDVQKDFGPPKIEIHSMCARRKTPCWPFHAQFYPRNLWPLPGKMRKTHLCDSTENRAQIIVIPSRRAFYLAHACNSSRSYCSRWRAVVPFSPLHRGTEMHPIYGERGYSLRKGIIWGPEF